MAICGLRSRLSIISLISVSVCCSCLLFPTVYAASANQYNDGNYRAPPSVTCKPAKYYSDHMVLQRGGNGVVLWGYSGVGYNVNITFKGVNYTTRATPGAFGPDIGVWQVVLPPQPAGGPETINITCSDPFGFYFGHFQISDVLFGDVWICSGQSNMAFSVTQVMNAAAELKDAINFPDVRVLSVQQAESDTPYYDVDNFYRPWSKPSPDALGANSSPDFLYFSAVCWFFGRDLYKQYQVPIGLISSNWGGTAIEDWSAPNVIDACYNRTTANHNTTKFTGPKGKSILWNSMIHPFLNMTLKGALWYQGEADTPDPTPYRCMFQGMITDWRYRWYHSSAKTTDPYFPFGFVQLCTSGSPTIGSLDNYSVLRWHQTDDVGFVPSAGLQDVFMAVSLDLPDLESQYGAIHPRYKQDVSARLAQAARVVAYQETGITYEGPFPNKFTIDSTAMIITVTYRSEGSGPIKITGSKTNTFEVCCSHLTTCQSTDLWTSTTVLKVVDTYSLQMSYNCLGLRPVAMRYLWRDYACTYKRCPIYNSYGLPAPPFMLPL